ncbi:MAG: polysaccharide pyruvyl transferase family protein [Candidatus Ornithomonoglobus sp.]
MYIGRYKGRRMIKNRVVENIFNTTDFLEMNKADRVKFFLNVPQWIKFVDGFDLFIGDRFHGSVSAILAGTPHVILPFDSRTRELTEYHNITSIHPHEIKEGSSIHDYIHKLDFKSFEKRHRGNFNHYVDFLKTNELDNIFTGNKAAEKGKSPLEREMEVLYDEIHCVEALHGMDKIERIIKYNTFALKRKVGHIWRKF